MPKMKTKSSAKKRFRVRPGGTVKRGQAFKRHILTKKSTKNKRHLRGATSVHETDMAGVGATLPGRVEIGTLICVLDVAPHSSLTVNVTGKVPAEVKVLVGVGEDAVPSSPNDQA